MDGASILVHLVLVQSSNIEHGVFMSNLATRAHIRPATRLMKQNHNSPQFAIIN